jgi:phenylalanyl-tRNA synthetase beta chain
VKYSLRWLREYATLDAPLVSIAKTLVDTGTEVGAVEVGGEGIVVARITAVLPVPGSSHLQFADIDLGPVPASLAAFTATPGTVRVMTGAPNVKVGDLVPYAPPGTRPPTMDDRLGVKTIRGHKSPGMLCSAIELGVGENADGPARRSATSSPSTRCSSSTSPPTGPIACATWGSRGSWPQRWVRG